MSQLELQTTHLPTRGCFRVGITGLSSATKQLLMQIWWKKQKTEKKYTL